MRKWSIQNDSRRSQRSNEINVNATGVLKSINSALNDRIGSSYLGEFYVPICDVIYQKCPFNSYWFFLMIQPSITKMADQDHSVCLINTNYLKLFSCPFISSDGLSHS